MKSIDEHEALHNLNPATDKLGRDRDFQENTAHSIKWLSNEVEVLKQRIDILEKK